MPDRSGERSAPVAALLPWSLDGRLLCSFFWEVVLRPELPVKGVATVSESRVFIFRSRMLSPFWTIVWVSITLYLLWRSSQAITGISPLWIILVALVGIVAVWTIVLKSVQAIVVESDGNVIFERYLSRREVNAIDIKRVRPWHDLPMGSFILRHGDGWELLPGRETTVEVVQELLKLNPAIEVRGAPEVKKHAS